MFALSWIDWWPVRRRCISTIKGLGLPNFAKGNNKVIENPDDWRGTIGAYEYCYP